VEGKRWDAVEEENVGTYKCYKEQKVIFLDGNDVMEQCSWYFDGSLVEKLMDELIKYKSMNESVRSMMKPKSEKEIKEIERKKRDSRSGIFNYFNDRYDQDRGIKDVYMDEITKVADEFDVTEDIVMDIVKRFDNLKINESVRDMLKPKPTEEVLDMFVNLSKEEMIEQVIEVFESFYFDEDITLLFYAIEKELGIDIYKRMDITEDDVWDGNVDLVPSDVLEQLSKEELIMLYKKLNMFKTNESVRDMLKPIPEEEMQDKISKMTPEEKVQTGFRTKLMWLVKQGMEDGYLRKMSDNQKRRTLYGAIQLNNKELVYYLITNGVKVPSHALTIARRYCGLDMISLLRYKKDKAYESVRDFLKPKPKEEIKKIIDRLPERERLAKGIKMDVFSKEEIDEMLNGMSPREYFLNSFVIEDRKKFNERPMLDKARKLMKPFKRVRIGDLLTYCSISSSYDSMVLMKSKKDFPMGKVIEKLIFKEKTEFWDYVKLRQLSNKKIKLEVDERLKSIYQTNTWMKVNCVVMEIWKPEWVDGRPILYNVIYEYGTTAGVFNYTKKDLENSEYENI
jgi:hypothetical protein